MYSCNCWLFFSFVSGTLPSLLFPQHLDSYLDYRSRFLETRVPAVHISACISFPISSRELISIPLTTLQPRMSSAPGFLHSLQICDVFWKEIFSPDSRIIVWFIHNSLLLFPKGPVPITCGRVHWECGKLPRRAQLCACGSERDHSGPGKWG